MKILKNFFKFYNLHFNRFPSRGHDPVLWKKSILIHFGSYRAPFGPKKGPIWKFSKKFSKFLISTPKESHRGVMSPYLEKSEFSQVLGHIAHLLGPKMGQTWKFSKHFSKFVISTPKEFHRGVMTPYLEKSLFWPILGHIRHLLGPKWARYENFHKFPQNS